MTQCHQPEPVGASGSCAMSAKLFVPAGGFFHSSGGETFSPVHPIALNEYFGGIAALFLNAALVNVKAAASTVLGAVRYAPTPATVTIIVTPIFQPLLIVRL